MEKSWQMHRLIECNKFSFLQWNIATFNVGTSRQIVLTSDFLWHLETDCSSDDSNVSKTTLVFYWVVAW